MQKDLCIAKLYGIRKKLQDEFKDNKIDETNFNLLMGRVEKYLEELKK